MNEFEKNKTGENNLENESKSLSQENFINEQNENTNLGSSSNTEYYGEVQNGYYSAKHINQSAEYEDNKDVSSNSNAYRVKKDNIFQNTDDINTEPIKDQNRQTYEESPISIVNMNSENKEHKKTSKFRRRVALGITATVLFGLSVGVGVGIGTDASEVLFPEKGDTVGFKFDDVPEAVALSATDTDVVKIVKEVGNSVVNISVTVKQTGFFNEVYENSGAGSGVIFKQDDEKIYIVTNNHVVDGASNVSVSVTGTEKIPAKLVGKDAQSDLAVISISKTDIKAAGIEEIKEAVFADSDTVEVGEYVLAIGNALGQGKTVTQGIISAQNKSINIDGKNLTVLQTDAAINPGNSGGALVDINGNIIGINTAKTASSSVEGTGYAIPSSTVRTIAEELILNGTSTRPYLGIVGFTITEDFKNMYNINVQGVFIKGVEQNSAAESAGIKSTDIITSINGTEVASMEELSSAISKCKVGDKVTLGVVRNGYQQMTAEAVLQDMNQQF